MKITDWPEEQRPRERLIRQGASALSDAELLAVFLRTGIPGKSAVELGRDMIGHFGSLNGMFAATLNGFSAIKGLGPAKFAQLQAVMELARRALSEDLQNGVALDSPAKVRQYLQLMLANKSHESFVVLYLDVKNRLVSCEELFRGTLTRAVVYPREVVKAALTNNAAAVIIAHNHPSGSPQPSAADHTLTTALKNALALVDIRIVDHVVVAGSRTFSFVEHGLL